MFTMHDSVADQRPVQLSVASNATSASLAPSGPAGDVVARPQRTITLTGARVVQTVTAARRAWPRGGVALSFILAVVLPTFAVAFYTLAWASERYVSEFRAAVRTIEPVKAGGLAALFGFSGVSQAGNDSHAVVQYIQSREAIGDLEKAMPLRQFFTNASLDWFSRLKDEAQIEEVQRYWRRMVDAYYESTTGTIIVRVSGFAPVESQLVAAKLLGNAEALINRMSARAREDTVRFAEGEVAKVEARLAVVRERVRLLQDRESILDPKKTAETTLTLAARLRDEIARRSAELATQRRQLSDTAPSVRATRDVIAGLQQQLEAIERQATLKPDLPSGESSKPLSSVLGAFQQVADEAMFAEKAYQGALASLEAARMDANRQQAYLATIVYPGLPQEPAFPRPLRDIGLAFLLSGALWLIGLLGYHSVKEHM